MHCTVAQKIESDFSLDGDWEQASVPTEFDGDTQYDVAVDAGYHCDPELEPHLHGMLQAAIDNGLPNHLSECVRHLLDEYSDVFRIKLGSDPPVKNRPMQIRLQPGAESVRVNVQRYPQPKAAFLRSKVAELEEPGLVRRSIEPAWAFPPLIVHKDGPEKYRFKTGLRPVNKVTIPHAWHMPDLESVSGKLAGKTCFATIDLCKSYWQLPLAEDSQDFKAS